MREKEINGYQEWGTILTNDHKTVGFTPKRVQEVIELLKHPQFAYTRMKNYGIAVYVKDSSSPTGVINAGGIPKELEFLIKEFQNYGQPLSPTEDLRTAH